MKKHQMRLVTVIKALCLLSVISASELYAASLDDVLGVRSSTTVEGAKSQAKIDEVTEQTRDLLQQFKTVMKVVDGLQVYNQQQRRLIKNQEDELGELEESIDNTYGTTIEAYTDVIQLEGKSRQVDMLKWGRVSLVFQTPDAESTGVWNNETRAWVMLPDEFRTGVRDGLRIARKTQTADLVHLPVSAPGE